VLEYNANVTVQKNQWLDGKHNTVALFVINKTKHKKRGNNLYAFPIT